MARTDIHRPSAIEPHDYVELVLFSSSQSEDGPAWNMERMREVREELTAAGAEQFGSSSNCGVCGAWFVHGSLCKHEPTGAVVFMGHDCADKYGAVIDQIGRKEWAIWQKEAKRVRRDAARNAQANSARAEFLAANPGIAEALEVDHYILQDMARKLKRYGSLSEKQVAFAFKLAEENAPEKKAAAQAKRDAEQALLVDAPLSEERTAFTGQVLSIKYRENDMFNRIAITLKVTVDAEAGTHFLLWGTCPATIAEDERLNWNDGRVLNARDFVATFNAKVNRAAEDKPSMAFFSRPTKPVLNELS